MFKLGKIIFIFAFFMIGLVFKINNVNAVSTTPSYNIDNIKKVNENNEMITDAEFEAHTVDNEVIFNYRNNNNGTYNLDFDAYIYDNIDKFIKYLPEDEYKNIDTIEQAKNIENSNYNSYTRNNNLYSEVWKGQYYVPLILEETKVPKKYQKADKYVLLVHIQTNFNYNHDQDIFTKSIYGYSVRSHEYHETYNVHKHIYFKYDENYDYSKALIFTDEEYNEFYDKYYIDLLDEDGNAIIVDKLGEVDLSISSTIDDKLSVKTKRGKSLSYKVVVQNKGTITSYGNIIKTSLPDGLEYVDGSANDNGVYDKDTNTITWNLDTLDSNEEKILTFKVLSTDMKSKYIVKTNIQNEDMTEVVNSNDVEILIETSVDNPNTSDNILLYVITSLLSLTFLVVFTKQKINLN